MSFFEDFRRLKSQQPHLALRGFRNVGCEYNDFLYFSKVCYMCFDADKFENCFYTVEGCNLKDCCDCSTCDRCELCYGCLDCRDCFDGTHLQDCRRTSESSFCYDCIGCNNCFGCAGLRQQKFCLFNEQLSKEEYEKGVNEWKMKGEEAIWAKFEKLKEEIPHQHSMLYRCENSSGNQLENTQNSFECFNSSDLQDCGHLYRAYTVYGEKNVDTWDVGGGVDFEMCYQMIFTGKAYNSSFCYYGEVIRDCDYCFQVFNSKNCFGCVGVNQGEYMILNKKYSEEEYFKKKAEIIEGMKESGEWGEWPLLEGEKFDC
jgi:hypothetical protein